MSKIAELSRLGQSVWCDYIRRAFLTSGGLQELIRQGVRGVTSNPAIFEKAIAGSTDYDADLKSLAREGQSVVEIYEALAVADIVMAADQLAPLYEKTEGADGFVSLEVSPFLARDTQATVAEAKRLFGRVGRPNLMIKVPATAEGLPAITELIGAGVNVNVTLIFSVDNYREVAGAFLSGVEGLALRGPSVPGGHPVDRIASVASFFVSRLDSALDPELEKKGLSDLMGRVAVANSKTAYQAYRRIFQGPRWAELAARGARAQRVLWASTSTKNPKYPDTLYVDELIGAGTVNTIPPETLQAFLDHGRVAETLGRDPEQAEADLRRVSEAGIDLAAVTRKLQEEGVAAFAKPFEQRMASIEKKRSAA